MSRHLDRTVTYSGTASKGSILEKNGTILEQEPGFPWGLTAQLGRIDSGARHIARIHRRPKHR